MTTDADGGLLPDGLAPLTGLVLGLIGLPLYTIADVVLGLGTATTWWAVPLWTTLELTGVGLIILGPGWFWLGRPIYRAVTA